MSPSLPSSYPPIPPLFTRPSPTQFNHPTVNQPLPGDFRVANDRVSSQMTAGIENTRLLKPILNLYAHIQIPLKQMPHLFSQCLSLHNRLGFCMDMHIWSYSYTLRTSWQSKLEVFVPVPLHMHNIISTFTLTVKIPCDYHPWGTFPDSLY